MVFLLVIWSPKQSKFKESYLESMEKQWKAQNHKEPKLWSFKVLCHKQIFWSTSWSSIYAYRRFEAREVSNLMLQTVHDSKLKWMSYNHWKPITPSWRQISQGCEISLWLRNGVLHAAKFRNPLARLQNSPKASRYLRLTFWDFFCFRYLMSKSPNSPCNPPIIGFLSL